jgi:aminoglycoside N3'-acetyltransferase
MEVYTKQSLISNLQKSGTNPEGALLVHSSVRSVGKCEN